MLAVLWTGAPEAVLSHDTALDAYEVSDINPTSIHITVAKKRRIARQGGEGYTLHHQDLTDNQKTWWEGIPIVTLYTAIGQGIASKVPTYLLRQAIERGHQLGLLLDCEQAELMELLEKRYER
jgi:predicted transcriptional regulator of viral defense system